MDTRNLSSNASAAQEMLNNDGIVAGSGGSAAYQKAIVIEFLSNPEEFDFSDFIPPEDEDAEEDEILDPNTNLNGIPRNSILVRLGDTKSGKLQVAYPFFPSHIQFPIKPGEKAWVIDDSGKLYWMARVSGEKPVEDTNYSHHDRAVLASPEPEDTKEKAEQQEGTTDLFIPSYNDGDESGSRSLDYDESNPNSKLETYDILRDQSKTQNYVIESVPRFTKRPGDLVIQGSNNTLICLGADRGWTRADQNADIFSADSSILSNSNQFQEDFSGVVDIVVGRGFENTHEAQVTPTDANAVGTDPIRTEPKLIKNASAIVEVDKNPSRNQIAFHHTEGDPCFWRDTSRIYVAMATDVDSRFSTGVSPGDNITYSAATTFEGEQGDTTEKPFSGAIALKSDNIRIIARKDEAISKNGSILIIKEGDPTADEDHCSMLFAPDGKVHVSAQKIFLGRSSIDSGIGGGPGPDGAQPYVKYQELEDLFNAIMDNIKTFCDGMTAAPTPGYGTPSPAIDAAVAQLKADMDARKGEIENLKSERIFGE